MTLPFPYVVTFVVRLFRSLSLSITASLFQDEIERADADQTQRRQREEILAREERAEQVCVCVY